MALVRDPLACRVPDDETFLKLVNDQGGGKRRVIARLVGLFFARPSNART
jgi:hypothetical protein